MLLQHPAINGPYRLVDKLYFTTQYGHEDERTIIELFRATKEPNLYRCIVWVQEMFKCEPSDFSEAERSGLGGLPDHDFRVDQTPLRMTPKFCPDGFHASNDEEALQKAFDAYCFCLDHTLARCSPADNHTLADCKGVDRT